MYDYDVCVIGGGPAGYAACIRALDYGKKVALIEKERIGGAGIWRGALSSKTMWELAQKFHKAADLFKKESLLKQLTLKEIQRQVQEAEQLRYTQMLSQLAHYQRKGLLKVFHGKGKVLTPHKVAIENKQTQTITADYIILAVGTRPRHLPDIPIDGEVIVTSDEIFNWETFPKSLVIVGAGVIGCEFATIFGHFGHTKVYLIDRADRILPFEDEDVAGLIAQNLKRLGVHIHQGARLQKMDIINGQVYYELKQPDGSITKHWAERALISVGRVPNTEDLGIKELGIKMSPSGHVIDNDTQTNIENIYAIGDLTADICLVNVGEVEGVHAIDKIYGKKKKPIEYRNISTIMFLEPEVAAVGLNEQQAKKEGVDYRVSRYGYRYINRAIAMGRTDGFFKLLVTPEEPHYVLGMRAVGEHASSAIQTVALMIQQKIPLSELDEVIHAHPSIPEGIQECARWFFRKSIIKPALLEP